MAIVRACMIQTTGIDDHEKTNCSIHRGPAPAGTAIHHDPDTTPTEASASQGQR
jgi:hypothetical protein